MYKVKLGIAPSFISVDSVLRRQRSPSEFYNYNIPKSVRYGEETLRPLRPKVWHILPSDIKTKIRLWIPKNGPCRLFVTDLYILYCIFFLFIFHVIALNKPAYTWFLRIQSYLSIADTCGSAKKCPL